MYLEVRRDRWWANDVVFERSLFVLVQKALVQVGDKTPLRHLDVVVLGRPSAGVALVDLLEVGLVRAPAVWLCEVLTMRGQQLTALTENSEQATPVAFCGMGFVVVAMARLLKGFLVVGRVVEWQLTVLDTELTELM